MLWAGEESFQLGTSLRHQVDWMRKLVQLQPQEAKIWNLDGEFNPLLVAGQERLGD